MATTSLTWERVSASHPCSICGRPDWCKRAGATSICYRVDTGLGRAKTDSAGRPYWAYGAGAEGAPILPSPSVERADPDTLHAVYSALLARCPLRERHRNDLRERGLSGEWIEQAEYGSLPSRGRPDLAKLLLEEFGEHRLRHIPGCYVHEEEQRSWWSVAGAAGLLIPVRDPERRVVALLARSGDPDAPARYSWVSSSKYGGASPGSPIHIPSADWTDEIRVTEGVLKADVATALSETLTLGLPGVSVHAPAVALCDARTPARVLLAFDADQRQNLTVALALQRTMGAFREAGLAATLEVWDGAKGIDDALHAGVPRQVLTGTVADALLTGTIALAQQAVSQAAGDAGDYSRMDPEQVTAAAATAETALRDGAALTEEQRWALAHLRHDHAAEWMALRTRLGKVRGFSFRDLDKSIPRIQNVAEAAQDTPGLRRAGDVLDECPAPDFLIPPSYTLSGGGLYLSMPAAEPEGVPYQKCIAPAPILISAALTNLTTKEEHVRLAWHWPRQGWRSLLTSRGVIASGRRLTEHAARGFPVADTNSQDLVAYLHKAEALNRATVPHAWVSSHLGWQGKPTEDASFLYGRTQILPTGENIETADLDTADPEHLTSDRIYFHAEGDAGSARLLEALHPKGTMDAWRAAVAQLVPYPKALIALYAAFAAPLLELMECPNFALDYACGSSSGKTTLLRVAASVWGCPDERQAASLIGTWDATQVSTERTGHLLNSLPMFLDETKKVRNPKLISPMLYAITSGHGRGRGSLSGLAEVPTWHTILYSTGEDQVTSFAEDGGARTRTLSITGMPFGAKTPETASVVNSLNPAMLANYGHAGPAFVSWLMEQREHWPRWRERYETVRTAFASEPPTAETGRLAAYAALILTAGAMAHEALQLPWPLTNPFLNLWAAITAEAAEADNAVRALELVRSWADGNEAKFYGRSRSDLIQPAEMAGRWDEGDWEWLGFFAAKLDSVLTEGGFNPRSIRRAWAERGWLLVSDAARNTHKARVGGASKWLVAIRREAFDEAFGEDHGED